MVVLFLLVQSQLLLDTNSFSVTDNLLLQLQNFTAAGAYCYHIRLRMNTVRT